MMKFTDEDCRWMGRALALARRGQGFVEPNPMVGAVLIKGGKNIGEGWHHYYGGPHAEVDALTKAVRAARGATLYVTLEPCCHWGKTPPCTDAIVAAGIRRVVVAMKDPFAAVDGRGIRRLRAAGIGVDVGCLENDARRLNAPFLTRIATHRPYVIAKWAQSMDGCIATAMGESKWISGEASREFVQQLRGRVDGIIIGRRTAERDNPLLVARPARGEPRRIATRIVLDTRCRLNRKSQLVRTVHRAPLLVVHASELDTVAERRRTRLADAGVMTLALADARRTGNNPPPPGIDLRKLLAHLARLDYTNLLVEGGAQVFASLLQARLIDECHIFIAPLLIGGADSLHVLAGPNLQHLSDAQRFHFEQVQRKENDIHLIATRRQ